MVNLPFPSVCADSPAILTVVFGTGLPSPVMSLPPTLICWPIAKELKIARASEVQSHFIFFCTNQVVSKMNAWTATGELCTNGGESCTSWHEIPRTELDWPSVLVRSIVDRTRASVSGRLVRT